MITREFLESIQDLESVLKMKRRELAHLRETLDLKGVSYENIGAAAGSRKTDAVADKICTIVDFEEHIKADEQRLAAMRIEATVAIGMLESEQMRDILTRKYLQYHSVQRIMDETNYSESSIYTYLRKGLKKIAENCSNLQ